MSEARRAAWYTGRVVMVKGRWERRKVGKGGKLVCLCVTVYDEFIDELMKI